MFAVRGGHGMKYYIKCVLIVWGVLYQNSKRYELQDAVGTCTEPGVHVIKP